MAARAIALLLTFQQVAFGTSAATNTARSHLRVSSASAVPPAAEAPAALLEAQALETPERRQGLFAVARNLVHDSALSGVLRSVPFLGQGVFLMESRSRGSQFLQMDTKEMSSQPAGPPPAGPPPAQKQPSLGDKIGIAISAAIFFLLYAFIYEFAGFRQTPESGLLQNVCKCGFKEGFCWLSQDLSACCCAFCCTGIRWADTLSREHLSKANDDGIVKFGYSFWAMLCIPMIFLICFQSLLSTNLVFVIIATMYRQKLRRAYGGESGGLTIFEDFLAWCCCMPCAALQEARQVENMMVEGA